MPSVLLNGNFKISVLRQATKILHRNDGIIRGGDDRDRHGERGKGVSRKRITTEIFAIISEFRIPGHDGLGQRHAGFVMEDLFKAVELRETALFSPERPLPLGHKIDAVNGEPFVDGQRGLIGIERGADGEGPSEVWYRRVGLAKCNPKYKISSQ